MTVIRCRIFFVHQFGTGNASFSPGLIQEIDNRGTQRKMLVPVQLIPPKVSQRPLK